MAEALSRRGVAQRVARRLGITAPAANRVVAETFEAIADELAAGQPVAIRGFGVFEARRMAPVMRRRPDTQTAVEVGEKIKPAFRASGALKRRLNGDEDAGRTDSP